MWTFKGTLVASCVTLQLLEILLWIRPLGFPSLLCSALMIS